MNNKDLIRKQNLFLVCAGAVAAAAVLAGCDKKNAGGGEGLSTLTLSMPQSAEVLSASKSGDVSAFSGRKTCFAVSVRGPGIPGVMAACTPDLGVFAGYGEPGSTMTLLVPKGNDRTVEVFAYLLPSGQTGPCPRMNVPLPSNQLRDTYLIGTAGPIAITQEEQTVQVNAALPASSQNITVQLNMSSACVAAAQPPTGINAGGRPFGASPAAGFASGVAGPNTLTLQGRAGAVGVQVSQGSSANGLIKMTRTR